MLLYYDNKPKTDLWTRKKNWNWTKNTSIYREFSNERTRVERRETFRKLRMKENFSKAFEGYFQWIIRAGEL